MAPSAAISTPIAAEPRSRFWPRGCEWGFVAFLFAATFAAYLPVWRAGFIWDDDSHLTANACIVGPLGFSGIWTSAEGYYFPLTTTTLWLVHALAGLNPLPYHVLNVVLHAANGILLWRVLLALRVPGAWFGALLWTLHPVQVESVAWISELKNTQSALFYLLAVWFYVRWVTQQSDGVGRPARTSGPTFYGCALLCGTAAVLSKSSTVMLPVVLGLCDWWVRQGRAWTPFRAVGGSGHLDDEGGERSPRPTVGWWALGPFFAVSLVASVWTVWEQRFHSAAAGAEWNLTIAQRLIVAGKDGWFYLAKLAWPHPLIFIYPRWSAEAMRPLEYLPIVAVAGALWIVWRWRRRMPAVAFAMAYFAVSIFPVLGLFNVYFFRYSYVGDHFQYLASMGPLALAGAGMAVAGKRWRGGVGKPRPAVAATVAIAATLVSLSYRQAGTYHDNETLFRSVIERNPSSAMAYNNLGLELAKTPARQDEALADFRAAVRLKPDSAEIHYNLANSLKKRPDGLGEAITHYEEALRLKPDYAEAHNNLALALEQVPGRLDDAITHFEAALHYKPENARAHNNLGVVLATNPARATDAIAHYEAALKLDPNYAMAHKNFADVLQSQPGRENEAQEHYEAALWLQPDFAEAHNNLGILLARQSRFNEAAQHWQRALELKPDYEDPRRNLELLRRPQTR